MIMLPVVLSLLRAGLYPVRRLSHGGKVLAVATHLFSLIIFCCCLSLLIGSSAAVSETVKGESRFHRTVAHLQAAPPEVQSQFAFTALTVLAQAHAREAALAREELQLNGKDRKLLGWSIAVDQYANQLLVMREDLEPAIPPGLSLQASGPLTLVLGERSIILSHPRSDQQSAFEQSILFEFCTRYDCDLHAATDIEREAIPVSYGRVRPDWIFSAQGPVCSYQGIQVQFTNAAQMAMSRSLCEQFLQEMMLLNNELAWQRRHAVIVEWEHLAIAATPGQPEHMIRLNSLGDSVLASTPVLYSAGTGLLEKIKPWLRAREGDGGSLLLLLIAQDYGWEGRAEEK